MTTLRTHPPTPTGAHMPPTEPIRNPSEPPWWPCPDFVTPDMEGPAKWSLMPCGCHLRKPDYEAVLCAEHLAELNAGTTQ